MKTRTYRWVVGSVLGLAFGLGIWLWELLSECMSSGTMNWLWRTGIEDPAWPIS